MTPDLHSNTHKYNKLWWVNALPQTLRIWFWSWQLLSTLFWFLLWRSARKSLFWWCLCWDIGRKVRKGKKKSFYFDTCGAPQVLSATFLNESILVRKRENRDKVINLSPSESFIEASVMGDNDEGVREVCNKIHKFIIFQNFNLVSYFCKWNHFWCQLYEILYFEVLYI